MSTGNNTATNNQATQKFVSLNYLNQLQANSRQNQNTQDLMHSKVNKNRFNTLDGMPLTTTNHYSQGRPNQPQQQTLLMPALFNQNDLETPLAGGDSPTNEQSKSKVSRFASGSKVGVPRKGHQVTQSGGFKKVGRNVNKSFDIDRQHHNSFLNNNLVGSGPAVNQSINFNHISGKSIKNGPQTNPHIVAQFQTIQQIHNSMNQKRNLSISIQKRPSHERKPSKPNSRVGNRSGENTNSRGSRFITSNNQRIGDHPEEFRTVQNQTVINGDATLIISNQAMRNFTDGTNTGIATSTNQQNGSLSRPKTSVSRNQASNSRNGGRYTTIAHNDSDTIQHKADTRTSDLKEELEQIIKQNQNYIAPLDQSINNQPKSFIIKKGERNEGLRNYLRKSLDSKSNVNGENTLQDPLRQSVNNIPSKSPAFPQQRIKRKRDFSKVVGVGQPSTTGVNLLNVSMNNPIATLTPSRTTKAQVSNKVTKNLYQEEFQTIQENDTTQFRTIQPNENQDTQKPTHQRSNTSHKFQRPQPNEQQVPTIQLDENSTTKAYHSVERRPSSKQQPADQNLRASITQEVTTQPVQDQTKKLDNCVSKFAFATKTGFSPSNPYKVNQDSFLTLPHLGEYRRTHFFSVCDGHGVYGKEVSDFVKTMLGQRVEHEIKYIFDQAKQVQRVVDSNEVKEALAKSFYQVNQGLYTSSGIDIYFSGSTCVSILIVGNKVFCANVGDSRAILAREVEPGTFQGFPLNRDHKANEPDEEKRILDHGGRVDSFKDAAGNPLGPLRIWHANENIPGLAMTRSFGDHCAAEVGCIAEPEILEMNLTEEDKFIVLASDGVWEFLSNDEVARIVQPHYKVNSAEKAAEALIRESLKKWKQEENVVDDITCIVIFLSIQ